MKPWLALLLLGLAVAGGAAEPKPDKVAAALATAEGAAKAGRWRDALKAGDQLRTLTRERHGENHPDSALAELFLGEVRNQLGDRTIAEAHFRRALAIQEAVLPASAPELITTLTRLAACLKEQRRYAEAAGLLQRALDLQLRLSGEGDEASAVALTNLARVLRLKGDLARAGELQERALAIRRAKLGGIDRETISGLRELAHLREAAGDLPAAEMAAAERVVAVEAQEGAQSSALVSALVAWARLAELQEDFSEAEIRYRRAVVIAETAHLHDWPALARVLDAHGWCLRWLGRYDEARPILQRGLDLRREALGSEHPDIATSSQHLGWVLRLQRQLDAARPLFEQALSIREAAFGPSHALAIESLAELGDLDWVRGAYGLAAQSMETRRYRAEEAFGPANEQTMAAWHALAVIYESARRWPQAIQAAVRSLELREKQLGPADAQTMAELILLARICTSAGAFDPALAQFARLAQWFRQHPEAHAARRAEFLRQYAITVLRGGRRDEAGALFRESRKAHESGLGPNAPETLRSIADLWTFYDQTRQPAFALEVARELAARTERAQGAAAPATAEVLERLGQLCLTLGDEAEAGKHFRRAVDARRAHYGEGSPQHLSALAKVCDWFEQVRDFPAAITWRTERLGAVRRKLGPDSAETAAACGDLAMSYFRQRDFRSARGMFESQWALVTSRGSADGPEALTVIARLGDVAAAEGKWDLARQERERLVAGCARHFGPEHVEHGRALLLLGEVLQVSGGDAVSAFTRAHRLMQAAGPAESARVARAAAGLARGALRAGDRAGAKRWALDALGRSFSGEEPLIGVFAALGAEFSSAGEDAAAEGVLSAAAVILEEVGGARDETAVSLLRDLGILRLRLGREGAGDLLESAVAGSDVLFGTSSAPSAEVLGWLALARVRERRWRDAQAAAERRFRIHENLGAATVLDASLLAWTTHPAVPDPEAVATAWLWAEPLAGWLSRRVADLVP